MSTIMAKGGGIDKVTVAHFEDFRFNRDRQVNEVKVVIEGESLWFGLDDTLTIIWPDRTTESE